MEFASGILPRSVPFIITSREKDYFIQPAGNKGISVCNREGADTRLVLHASKVDSDVVAVCKDTDVIILMIWSYSKLNIINNWYLKQDHNKFADIRKICSHLGKTLPWNLPKIYVLRECYTTSYFYRVGMIKVFKKLLGQQDLCFLLSELGNYSQITNSVIEEQSFRIHQNSPLQWK